MTWIRSKRYQRASGYTLIELLMIIALLGLASAILAPYLVNRSNLELQAAVRLIIGDLSFAQADALAHQEHRRVHFYADGSGYCLLRVDQTEVGDAFNAGTADYIFDPIARGGQQQQYIVKFSDDDRFRDVSIKSTDIDGADGADVYYDAIGGTVMNGGGPGIGGTIVVESGTSEYEVTIAPFTGKLTVQRLN